jgi:hypothetical protein
MNNLASITARRDITDPATNKRRLYPPRRAGATKRKRIGAFSREDKPGRAPRALHFYVSFSSCFPRTRLRTAGNSKRLAAASAALAVSNLARNCAAANVSRARGGAATGNDYVIPRGNGEERSRLESEALCLRVSRALAARIILQVRTRVYACSPLLARSRALTRIKLHSLSCERNTARQRRRRAVLYNRVARVMSPTKAPGL